MSKNKVIVDFDENNVKVVEWHFDENNRVAVEGVSHHDSSHVAQILAGEKNEKNSEGRAIRPLANSNKTKWSYK